MSGYDTPTTTTAPAAPQTVVVAYWLYVIGAIIGLVGAILLLVTLPAQLAASQALLERSLQGRSTGGVDVGGIATGSVIGGVVFGDLVTLAFSVLTIVFAVRFRRGRNWARVVLAVFAALQIVGAFNFSGTYGVSSLHFVIVLIALILSFLPASNAWFRMVKASTQAAPVV